MTSARFRFSDPVCHYLDRIVVDPAYWGRGAADAFLTEVRRLGLEHFRFDVHAEKAPAVAFHARNGFTVVGPGVRMRSGLKTLALEWRGPDVA